MMQCGKLSEESYCSTVQSCTTSIVAEGSGPAGFEVLNSLITIQGMYQYFYDRIKDVETQVLYDLDLFFSTFSSIPDDTVAFNIIMDSLGLLVPAAMATIFNSLGTWVSIAKDTNAGDYGWDADDEIAFKSYMGDVWRGWKNSTEMASKALFNGSDSTVTLLTRMIKDRKLIAGSSAGNEAVDEITSDERKAYIEKSFYAYVIPQVWQKSGQNVFIIDTGGLACDDSNPVSDYLDDSTAETTQVCFQDKRYYLVHLNRDASNSCQDAGNASGTSLCFPYTFSVPPGLETLGTTLETESVVAWGGLEPLDIVEATVNSYTNNNSKNGWSISGLSSYETVQAIEDAALIENNVRAAGHNTLPICSAEEAFVNWGVNFDLANYPSNDD